MRVSLKNLLESALAARGEHFVKRNAKHDVWSRREGGYYFLGKAGGLRFGRTKTESVPCSDEFKELLCQQSRSRR